MGIDPGERRVGIAVSDPDGIVATPYATIEVTTRELRQKLQEVALELKAEAVVVGMPLSLDGTYGPAAKAAEAQAVALREALDIPVFTHDERFTTAIAEQAMLEADLSRKRRKQVIDKSAATIMLQSWLDARSS